MQAFCEMEDSKQFVRKVGQPEKFNDVNPIQFNISYSNFFCLKVTNKHARCVDKCKKKNDVCSYIYYKFRFAWCRKFISPGTLQKNRS